MLLLLDSFSVWFSVVAVSASVRCALQPTPCVWSLRYNKSSSFISPANSLSIVEAMGLVPLDQELDQ